MSTAEQLAVIDQLCARPLPAAPGGPFRAGEGGPAFHLADLRVGAECREDDGFGTREAEEQLEAECEALVFVLSRRWGEPQRLDLIEYLVRSAGGEPVPEPLATLCGCVGVLYAWRAGDRWLAVGLGRQDRELPLRLLAVAAAEDPEGTARERPGRPEGGGDAGAGPPPAAADVSHSSGCTSNGRPRPNRYR
ncbi:hypothetical protein KBZ10_23340 [Streptomyces sp. F63]|uniref:hypothetical protein n=1 Tax=Streptomyces sp. F63 TaxID=2824887 RepID=UPI001B36F867|nr:hypothetical protein [Streptomyces sp. F63]MBQ0987399.1 hypothetical protein [Streptomyces sp. F63]